MNEGKYSAVQVGGYRLGDYKSKAAARRAIKEAGPGFYQIIANFDIGGGYWGVAVAEITNR